MAKITLITPDELKRRKEAKKPYKPRPPEQRPAVVILITGDEKEPWLAIARHFGWFVEAGKSIKEEPNPDFNAPLRRVAAAWVRNKRQARMNLTRLFDQAQPTPASLRKGRRERWKDNIRFTTEEALAWDDIAASFEIRRGRQPSALEAIRRLGLLATQEETWPLVTATLQELIDPHQPFVRLGRES